jgi:hypothetical protein
MDVDEAGRENVSVSLDDLFADVVGKLADRADDAGVNGDICGLSIGSAPIEYACIPDKCVTTRHTEW